MVDIKDILNYGFYDEGNKYTVVLDVEKLKELFEADVILLKEEGHK